MVFAVPSATWFADASLAAAARGNRRPADAAGSIGCGLRAKQLWRSTSSGDGEGSLGPSSPICSPSAARRRLRRSTKLRLVERVTGATAVIAVAENLAKRLQSRSARAAHS
jgi:hypothetical protein